MAKTKFTINREELKTVMERTFDAPREVIFKAFTDPEIVPQWWGPRNLKTKVDKMDVRENGEWRFINIESNGNEHAFYGIFQEVNTPKLITRTFNYEPIGEGHEITETTMFEDLGGGVTKVSANSIFNSLEDLDGMVASGMEAGATESWDRLAELVENNI